MPKRWSWLAVSAVCLGAGATPLAAATLLQKTIDVEIQTGGGYIERSHIEVRLDASQDLDSWSRYPVYVDDHRTLKQLRAWVKHADGTTAEMPQRDLDTVDAGEASVLHGSAKLRIVRFSEAAVGSVLGVDFEVLEHPYFPGGSIPLTGDEAIEHLAVRVHGAGVGWRWHLTGPRDGLTVAESDGGVGISGVALPRPPAVELAPAGAQRTVLRFAWGEPASWEAVGRWFTGVVSGIPRDQEAVRRTAREVTAGVAGSRAQLEALLAFARRQVRYVAVEMGIGGYRPAAPRETLERRWGDCKGKAFLLIDLLKEVGIQAYPVLIRAGRRDRIDPTFPAPFEFNHVIVALPVAGLATEGVDPVADGLLFVDPTQERGAARWLNPAVQDQDALVVRSAGAVLVRTPLLPRFESEKLAVELTASVAGDAAGKLMLDFTGNAAAELSDAFATQPPDALMREGRRILDRLLPGGAFTALRWVQRDGELPGITLTANVSLAGSIGSSEAGRYLHVAGPSATPAPGLLRERKLPVLLAPRTEEVSWQVTLPEGWCPAQHDQSQVANDLGSFRQDLACGGGVFTLVRRTELRRRWIEPESLPQLAEISLAEHRAAARRVRFDRLHTPERGGSQPAPSVRLPSTPRP